ncbi:unnamed protein product [Moneuplotes crassus]|uniref:UDENN domain-containing protein n=1 Tax=Euplotes crassus TaxID=5936 RepID=A0AAD1XJA4_EUPCR|nr:unnamed protein product [Moneuplotes crassus]
MIRLIVLERRRKTEIPLFLPDKESGCDANKTQSIASANDSESYYRDNNSKMVLAKQQMLSYFNSQLSGLSIENLDYDVLFKNLKPSRIVTLIEAMLLEKKIILVHPNHGILAVIIECLKSLIRPLKWCGATSSFMIGPNSLEFMDSPIGFIYGFSRKIWDRDIMINLDKSKLDEYFFEDSVILEIDKDYIKTHHETSLPVEKRMMLVKGIENLIGSKDEKLAEFTTKYPHLHSFKYDQLFWKYVELHTKRLFLNFFITTINNYLGYYKTEEEISKVKVLRAEAIFDFRKYFSSYPQKEQEFMKDLTNTQAFNLFIESSYKPNCGGDNDIKKFIQIIQMLEQDKFPTVDSIEKAYANPIKYDYDHCLKQYTTRINEVNFDEETWDKPEEGHILNFQFFSPSRIMQMPGINYDKIKVYREAKRHKKFTSMGNISDIKKNFQNDLQPKSNAADTEKKNRRFKSICNIRNFRKSEDMESPSADYLASSGVKKYNRALESRNITNSPPLCPKQSVNSSYGVIKFNISMEEDKLKSIRKKAKDKGLFKFDATSTMRLVKANSQVRKSKPKNFIKKPELQFCSVSPKVSTQKNSPIGYNRRKFMKKLSNHSQTFLAMNPSKNRRMKSNLEFGPKGSVEWPCNYKSNGEFGKTSFRKKQNFKDLKCFSRKLSPNDTTQRSSPKACNEKAIENYRYKYQRWKNKSSITSIFKSSNTQSRRGSNYDEYEESLKDSKFSDYRETENSSKRSYYKRSNSRCSKKSKPKITTNPHPLVPKSFKKSKKFTSNATLTHDKSLSRLQKIKAKVQRCKRRVNRISKENYPEYLTYKSGNNIPQPHMRNNSNADTKYLCLKSDAVSSDSDKTAKGMSMLSENKGGVRRLPVFRAKKLSMKMKSIEATPKIVLNN